LIRKSAFIFTVYGLIYQCRQNQSDGKGVTVHCLTREHSVKIGLFNT